MLGEGGKMNLQDWFTLTRLDECSSHAWDWDGDECISPMRLGLDEPIPRMRLGLV